MKISHNDMQAIVKTFYKHYKRGDPASAWGMVIREHTEVGEVEPFRSNILDQTYSLIRAPKKATNARKG